MTSTNPSSRRPLTGNAQLTLSDFPNEVLIQIFSLLESETDAFIDTTPPSRSAKFMLAMVCRQWKDLIWNTPQLWSTLSLNAARRNHRMRSLDQVGPMLSQHLACGQESPLDVTFSEIEMETDRETLGTIACPILGPSFARWTSVHLHSMDFGWLLKSSLLPGDLPALRTLVITDNGLSISHTFEEHTERVKNWQVPNLNRLILNGLLSIKINLPPWTPFLSQLSHLHVTGPIVVPLLMEYLNNTPQLECLIVEEVSGKRWGVSWADEEGIGDMDSIWPRVHLEKLTRIRIGSEFLLPQYNGGSGPIQCPSLVDLEADLTINLWNHRSNQIFVALTTSSLIGKWIQNSGCNPQRLQRLVVANLIPHKENTDSLVDVLSTLTTLQTLELTLGFPSPNETALGIGLVSLLRAMSRNSDKAGGLHGGTGSDESGVQVDAATPCLLPNLATFKIGTAAKFASSSASLEPYIPDLISMCKSRLPTDEPPRTPGPDAVGGAEVFLSSVCIQDQRAASEENLAFLEGLRRLSRLKGHSEFRIWIEGKPPCAVDDDLGCDDFPSWFRPFTMSGINS
ncbi:hypothetical protein CC2G_013497 [Coprinopsis cinerea AmutBmut pab1-1]|nr:hypothetical protein CC2G_013497 [Coprinopsis cinerea AmutBmut pab1-1]